MFGSPASSIEFQDVGLSYRDGSQSLCAVKGLSFTVSAGEAVAVIGPSGCGKSTMLHMAAGLIAPTEGAVLIDGQPVTTPRAATAFIPQDLGLFPWKTVLRNASLGLELHGVAHGEARERARQALGEVGLAGFENAFPRELSGGMKQRLALARALALDADVLLMDEPLSAIDALLRETLQDVLLELHERRGHTQVLVTHSIEEAVYLGERILVLTDRPASLWASIDNPGMVEKSYRDSAAFSQVCQQVRAALADAHAVNGEGPALEREGTLQFSWDDAPAAKEKERMSNCESATQQGYDDEPLQGGAR